MLFLFQLIKELQLKEEIGDQQMQQSKQNWELLMQKSREFFDTDGKTSEFRVMQKFLRYMISDAELLIVFNELPKNQNHPYVVAIEDLNYVEKALLIIEQSQAFYWSRPSTYDTIMSILASYYVFLLLFPPGCRVALTAVMNFIAFDKPFKSKKLMALLE